MAKILVIDDDPDSVQIMTDELVNQGYQVAMATDGARGLEVVQKEALDVVFLDVMLPDTSGLAILPQIKKQQPDTAVIIVTATRSLPVAIEAMRQGADDYLLKPIDLAVLEPVLWKNLEKTRLRRENRQLLQQLTAANETLRVSAEQRSREIAVLRRCVVAVSQSLNLQQVLQEIVYAAETAVNSTFASVVLVNEDGSLGVGAETRDDMSPLAGRARPEGITRRIIKTGQPVNISDAAVDPRANPALASPGVRSYAGAPIKDGERVVGVLFVHSRKERAFDDRLDLLCDFAGVAAAAIRNARLFSEVSRAQREWEMTFNATSDAICLLDNEHNIVRANAACAQLANIPALELVGRKCYEVFHGRSEPHETCPVEAVKNQRLLRSASAEVGDPRLGQYFRISADPILGADGEFWGFVCIMRDITASKIAEEKLRESVEQLGMLNVTLRETFLGAVRALSAAVEARDPYTAGHSERVCRYSVALARKLGLSPEEVEGIQVAAILHDLGKLAVPSELLAKPGELTQHEMALVRTHSEASAKIIEKVRFPWEVQPVVVQHHERHDGKGYPAGLKEDEIYLGARILALADAYDALTSYRPYRPARTIPEALEELRRNSGTQFDPRLVEAFIAAVSEPLSVAADPARADDGQSRYYHND